MHPFRAEGELLALICIDRTEWVIALFFRLARTSLSLNINDRIHRRTLSGGWNSNERPVLPPPLPPNATASTPTSSTNALKVKQRHSTSTMIDEEQPTDVDRDELNRSTSIEEKKEEPADESVNVGKVIAELNHRMANAKNSPLHRPPPSTATSSSTSTNRRYSSSFRNTVHQSSPGETTDF